MRRERLEKILAPKKNAILKRWFDATIKTYPPDAAKFFSDQKDPFDNPVGTTTHRSLSQLVDCLMAPLEAGQVQSSLDPIIRIRAVQTFTPSKAVSFVYDLKQICLELIQKDLKQADGLKSWLILSARIDAMALIAFDGYMACRERIFEIRANQEKTKIYSAFSRAGLIEEEAG